MLRELRLRDFAIAADVEIAFGPGLNVLTGSTGAGKSLVIEALRWLSGAPVDRDRIRSGAQRASAEALFDLSDRPDLCQRVTDLGVDVGEDGLMRLRRDVKAQGRSQSFVDARVQSAAVLGALFEVLVEVQSQHEQTVLRQAQAHRALLDDCGVASDLRESYRQAYREWREASARVDEWKSRRQEILAQEEMLRYQLQELTTAGLSGDELDGLRARVALLEGGAQLLEATAAARDGLMAEDEGVLTRLGTALAALARVPESVGELTEPRDSLSSALELVEEAARALDRFLDGAQFDPAELGELQERLATLESLCRKYGRTERELVALRDRLESELGEMGSGDELPAELSAGLETAREALEVAAAALHRARKTVSRRIEREGTSLLEDLGMREACLRFRVDPLVEQDGAVRLGSTRARPGAQGADEVVLEVRTNPGEPLRPVQNVASGGELSRIGLVLRTLAIAGRRPGLVLLDEVDAGLGNDLGPALARRLQAMAESSQLIVVTHLPAVAAAGRTHLVVRKGRQEGRTVSRVEAVQAEARIDELARMLGGSGKQPRTLAQQLLDSATAAVSKSAS